jgi:hypothetical protein
MRDPILWSILAVVFLFGISWEINDVYKMMWRIGEEAKKDAARQRNAIHEQGERMNEHLREIGYTLERIHYEVSYARQQRRLEDAVANPFSTPPAKDK